MFVVSRWHSLRIPPSKMKRKRAPHRSSCESCHKAHRSCDGNRPCGRCISLNKEDTCQTALSKKERRARQAKIDFDFIPVTTCFQVQPAKGSPPQQPLQQPPPQYIPQPTPPNPASPNHTIISPKSPAPAEVLVSLLQEVRELNEMTRGLKASHNELKETLFSIKQVDLPASPVEEWIIDSDQELSELEYISHEECHPLVPVSKDCQLLKESRFAPFVVEHPDQVAFLSSVWLPL